MARGQLDSVAPRCGYGLAPSWPPKHWPACLRWAGLLPARLLDCLDTALVDAFLYCLYGMYLTVLAERMAACSEERGGLGCTLFLRAL